jgi:hypothetical protein
LTQYIEKAALVQKCHAVDGMNFSKVLCVPYMYIYVYMSHICVQKCHAVDSMNFSKVLYVSHIYIYIHIYLIFVCRSATQ